MPRVSTIYAIPRSRPTKDGARVLMRCTSEPAPTAVRIHGHKSTERDTINAPQRRNTHNMLQSLKVTTFFAPAHKHGTLAKARGGNVKTISATHTAFHHLAHACALPILSCCVRPPPNRTTHHKCDTPRTFLSGKLQPMSPSIRMRDIPRALLHNRCSAGTPEKRQRNLDTYAL